MKERKAVVKHNPNANQPWHAVLVAKNGEIIATTENRTSKAGLVRMLRNNFAQYKVVVK